MMKALSAVLKRLAVCMILIILVGCWDRTEVNDVGIVVGLGLDKADDRQMELSVQLVNPSAIGGGQSAGGIQGSGQMTTVEKAAGKTAFDARSKLQQKVSRRLFAGHNRILVVSQELAEQGIRKHIDFFGRHAYSRLRTFAFVTPGKPTDLFNVMPDLESGSAEVARELANFKVGMSVTLKDALQMFSNETGSAALPLILTEEKPSGSTGLKVSGTAVFKNGKMAGQISDTMTRGVLWIRDEINTASITLEPENEKGFMSFNAFQSSSQLTPVIQNGTWRMTINIETAMDAVENETTLNLMKPDIIKKLESQLNKKVKQRIRKALDKVQQDIQADILGFDKTFHRHFPNQWQNKKDQWDKQFPEVEVDINVNARIERPGRSTSPQGIPEDEVTNQ